MMRPRNCVFFDFLQSEYKGDINCVELGRSLSGGNARKHKFYTSLTTGETVYLIMSEMELDHGVQITFNTEFGG